LAAVTSVHHNLLPSFLTPLVGHLVGIPSDIFLNAFSTASAWGWQ
jgi:hypothetical protein